MDEPAYELLAWLNAGHAVLRPAESTEEGLEAFRGLLTLLTRLRDQGLVHFAERQVTKTEAGMPLMVSPVDSRPRVRRTGTGPCARAAVALPRVHPWRAG